LIQVLLATRLQNYSNTAFKTMCFSKKSESILRTISLQQTYYRSVCLPTNRKRMSMSGVQGKFSVVLEKNKLRLIQEGEQGKYI